MRKKLFNRFLKGGGFLLLAALLSGCKEFIVLDSKGPVGQSEAMLIYIAFALMLIVVLPVFVMVIWFSIRYKANNTKATYKPNWSHSTKMEWLIWMVPVAIIAVLAYLTWTSTYDLDPYKPIEHELKPIEVEVISTDWNWVFIYPEDSVATVNELAIEAGRPVHFKLTSATVMTSFFIPQLGSQIYVMAGMQTQLHLLADHAGIYRGQNVEFSGDGYDKMFFNVLAGSHEEYREWIKKAKSSNEVLSTERFNSICEPQADYPVTYFSAVEPNLFVNTMAPYMQWMNHGMTEGGSCCHEGMSMDHEMSGDKPCKEEKDSCSHHHEGM